MRKRRLSSLVLALVVVFLSATAAQARSGDNFIKIGSITILTGPSATIGLETARGAQIMVNYINLHGGVLKQKLQLLSQDDANNPQLGVQAATQLIQQDHVVAIVGPTNSVSGIAIQPLLAQASIPAIAYQSGAEQLTATGSPWQFRSNTTLPHHFLGLTSYFAKFKKAKRFAFIGWNLAAGQSSLQGVQYAVAHLRGTSLVYQTTLPLTTQDFSGVIAQAKAANPDVVLIGAPMPFAGVLAKQIRESGWKVALGATGDFVTTDFGQFLGPAANGLIMTDTGHWKCAAKRKAGAAYIAYFKKTLGRDPDSNELVGADAVGAVAAAIRKAGSTDGQKLVDALHRMSYNGLRFAAQWDSKGNLKHTPIPIVVWAKDGAQLNKIMCDVQPVVHLKKGK